MYAVPPERGATCPPAATEPGGQGPAPSAHLAIQPILCNKRQHLTELRTTPSLRLLRHRPSLPRLRLLLAALPVLRRCQQAQPQAGLQEAGLAFAELLPRQQSATAKSLLPDPFPASPGWTPRGCSGRTAPRQQLLQELGHRHSPRGGGWGWKARGGSWLKPQGADASSPGWGLAPAPASPFCQLRQQMLQESFASLSAAKQSPRCNRPPDNRTPTSQHGDSRRSRRGEPRQPSDFKQRC